MPNIVEPTQLIRGDPLVPIVGSADGMLIGEIADRNRKIWVLSDPDVIANHGLAARGQCGPGGGLDLAPARTRRRRRIPGDHSRIYHANVESVCADVALPVCHCICTGSNCDCAFVVGIACAIWGAAARAGLVERGTAGPVAKRREPHRIHRSSASDDSALRPGNHSRRRPSAARAGGTGGSAACGLAAARRHRARRRRRLRRGRAAGFGTGGHPAARFGKVRAARARHSPMEAGDH